MRVPAERKGRVALPEGGFRRFGVNLLFGRQEAGQAVAELVEPEPLYPLALSVKIEGLLTSTVLPVLRSIHAVCILDSVRTPA